jgi:POT family proton-dependent oligopeptide transporter
MNSGSTIEAVDLAVDHKSKLADEKAQLDLISSNEKEGPLPEYTEAGADGSVPTDDELNTLRRVAGQVPWTAYTVAVVELCERFSYYGTTAVCMEPPSLRCEDAS